MLPARVAGHAALEHGQDVIERRDAQDHEPLENDVLGPRRMLLFVGGALTGAVSAVEGAELRHVLGHAAAGELGGELAEKGLELEGSA